MPQPGGRSSVYALLDDNDAGIAPAAAHFNPDAIEIAAQNDIDPRIVQHQVLDVQLVNEVGKHRIRKANLVLLRVECHAETGVQPTKGRSP